MHRLNRFLVTVTLATFVLGAHSAQAQAQAQTQNAGANTKNIVKRGYSQLFTYDPENSGSVAVSYVNKFSRLAALLVQPHTVKRTACGYLFQGMQGLPLKTAAYSIDISDDTVVSNKANLILVGIDRSGVSRVHQGNGLDFNSKIPSTPGWNTYSYNASTFSPAIGADETFSSFAISLLGGTTSIPDHTGHWLSHPVIDGINVRELINDSTVVTNGRLVGF